MVDSTTVYFIGYASDIAGSDAGSADGPGLLRQSPLFAQLADRKLKLHWEPLIQQINDPLPVLEKVTQQCTALAKSVKQIASQDKFFIVFGGDHSCAIGTWSGARAALPDKEELGLIWIDAHMDSHTPKTSVSGNIHGMPLASLLGYGDPALTGIMQHEPKLKPENICLIGIRSFEEGEAALLARLGVRIFFMEELKQRGIDAVMKEAISIVKKNTTHFGITVDIDAIDPAEAPGTGVAEPDGIRAQDISHALKMLAHEDKLIGMEIAEFDPHRDVQHITEKLITTMVEDIMLGEHDA